MREYRIGQGWDIHRFEEGKPLLIGGVEVPHDRGFLGHSDGDVAAHQGEEEGSGVRRLGLVREVVDVDAEVFVDLHQHRPRADRGDGAGDRGEGEVVGQDLVAEPHA